MESPVVVLLMLVVGLAVGATAAWLVLRARLGGADARSESAVAQAKGEAAAARAEAAEARTDAANARTEAATARGELARNATEVERVRAGLAEARQASAEAGRETAQARADLARLDAMVAKANFERDSAVKRAEELAADREAMITQFKVMSTEALDRQTKTADDNAEHRLKATEQLMGPLSESLLRFESRLTEVEKERVSMSTDLKAQVQQVQLTGESLRRETSALATALRKPQVRGAWGEMQLKRVVEVAGMVEHVHFLQQATSTTDDKVIRPDLKVILGEGKFVYVDSKVPLSAFLDAQETDDRRDKEAALLLFAKNVRTHVDQLAGKQYWKADSATPEFVVLFLASEAIAAEALQHLPDLHEYAAQKNVILATPTTLIAMLRTVAYSWNQAALAESAKEVSDLGRELFDRLAGMGKHFDKLGRALQTSVTSYNSAMGSMETRVLVSARKFRDLKVTGVELSGPRLVEETLRQISAPELVEDAAQIEPMIGRHLLAREEPDAQELALFATPLPQASPIRRANL